MFERVDGKRPGVTLSVAHGKPEGVLRVPVLFVVADGSAEVGDGFLPFALGEALLGSGGVRAAGFADLLPGFVALGGGIGGGGDGFSLLGDGFFLRSAGLEEEDDGHDAGGDGGGGDPEGAFAGAVEGGGALAFRFGLLAEAAAFFGGAYCGAAGDFCRDDGAEAVVDEFEAEAAVGAGFGAEDVGVFEGAEVGEGGGVLAGGLGVAAGDGVAKAVAADEHGAGFQPVAECGGDTGDAGVVEGFERGGDAVFHEGVRDDAAAAGDGAALELVHDDAEEEGVHAVGGGGGLRGIGDAGEDVVGEGSGVFAEQAGVRGAVGDGAEDDLAGGVAAEGAEAVGRAGDAGDEGAERGEVRQGVLAQGDEDAEGGGRGVEGGVAAGDAAFADGGGFAVLDEVRKLCEEAGGGRVLLAGHPFAAAEEVLELINDEDGDEDVAGGAGEVFGGAVEVFPEGVAGLCGGGAAAVLRGLGGDGGEERGGEVRYVWAEEFAEDDGEGAASAKCGGEAGLEQAGFAVAALAVEEDEGFAADEVEQSVALGGTPVEAVGIGLGVGLRAEPERCGDVGAHGAAGPARKRGTPAAL